MLPGNITSRALKGNITENTIKYDTFCARLFSVMLPGNVTEGNITLSDFLNLVRLSCPTIFVYVRLSCPTILNRLESRTKLCYPQLCYPGLVFPENP